MKREDEFVKRFWSVSVIFAGTVAEWVFQRVSVVVELEGQRTWSGLHRERGALASGDGFDGLRLCARGSIRAG